ncbi:MAG: hypothetical protein HEQ29_19225 [Dolichospermum sp. LBC05a]|nr:hypothetical protein [Dolichospermum sp. OL01]MCO5798788.1 hypothetical protein [Dolichospermum sp. OL03]MCS6280660.1 hypothetical protein [Dolichospermum sp.]QSV60200.1 MAG: hypothetical protein HEQ29_19225 [Dolichospermum sp. LBC05a]
MVDRINDIAWQAHQGSVAAIIQVLNERLVMSSVRTRAVFVNGVLQLLCEAATVEQLEQSTLVPKIQQILDSLAPRHIRRVNINSRIVKEEQLLWLEEIHRDTDNQLLWSQEITVSQPNLFKWLIPDLTEADTKSRKPILAKPQSLLKNPDQGKISIKTLVIGVSGLSSVILLAWLLDSWLGNPLKYLSPFTGSQSSQTANQSPPQLLNRPPSQSFSIPSDDPFVASVRLANQATTAGKTAITSTQWLELAANWQRASDLMSQVSPSHSRYQEAQIRTKLYRKFSEAAQKEAEKGKS